MIEMSLRTFMSVVNTVENFIEDNQEHIFSSSVFNNYIIRLDNSNLNDDIKIDIGYKYKK